MTKEPTASTDPAVDLAQTPRPVTVDDLREVVREQGVSMGNMRAEIESLGADNKRLLRDLSAALAKGREEALAPLREPSDELVEAVARYCFENSVFRKFPSAAEGWDHAPPQLRMPNLKYARLAIVAILRALSPSSPGEPLPPAADEIERVARAICAEYGDDYDEQPENIAALRTLRKSQGSNVYAHDPGLPTREDWRKMAAAGLAARRPSPGEPAGSGWQPIATAPKHGEILIWLPSTGSVYKASWDHEYMCWADADDHETICWPNDATHWHSLPAPPHERSEGEPTERPGAVDAPVTIAERIVDTYIGNSDVRDDLAVDITAALTAARLAGREEMRERAARLARTSKGYPTELSKAIEALSLQVEGEDTPHG